MQINDNLIFIHLPKNGGSTFNSILKRLYPPEYSFFIKIDGSKQLNTKDFLNLSAEKRSQIKLLSGHMYFGLHEYMHGKSKYITFLRKPQDRIVSYYYYLLSQPGHRLFKMVTQRNLSLYDFVMLIEENDIHNAQIRWISGINGSIDEMLEKALENIDNHFSFVGLLERFDESLILLKNKLDWSIPFYQTKNKTKNTVALRDLDNRTVEAINEKNVGDNILYEKMERRFSDQIVKQKDVKIELKKLKMLNALYTNAFFGRVIPHLLPIHNSVKQK